MSISAISSTTYPSLPSTTPGSGQALTEAQQQQVAQLQARDRQVRQHEQAHMAAAAGLAASGASYSYQQGPDGKRYAVGGEVSIDTSPGNTPQQTISRARQIQAAALAPADPSGQDRQIAAAAARMAEKARQTQQAETTQPGKPAAPQTETQSIGSQIDTYA